MDIKQERVIREFVAAVVDGEFRTMFHAITFEADRDATKQYEDWAVSGNVRALGVCAAGVIYSMGAMRYGEMTKASVSASHFVQELLTVDGIHHAVWLPLLEAVVLFGKGKIRSKSKTSFVLGSLRLQSMILDHMDDPSHLAVKDWIRDRTNSPYEVFGWTDEQALLWEDMLLVEFDKLCGATSRPVIGRFDGDHACFSNFHPSEITYLGLKFPTVEHAFQASKTLVSAEQEAIRIAATPGKAKRLGRKATLRDDWEQLKDGVMRHLLLLKFEDPVLQALLLATGDAVLIEGNDWKDTYWGTCNGEGQNRLGKLLMDVRDIYHKNAKKNDLK